MRLHPKRTGKVFGDLTIGGFDIFLCKSYCLISICYPLLVDTEQVDDIALGIFGNGNDMVCVGGDFSKETEHLTLVVESRERQAEGHKIMNGIDSAGRFRSKRKLVSAVKDIGPRIKGEVDKRL